MLSVEPTRTAYEQVADQLREFVLQGTLAPGEKLPPEPELGKMFGVSRGTIREAMRLLAAENFVTTARGVTGGTFVALPEPALVTERILLGLRQLSLGDHVTGSNLLEVRQILEEPAAALAAQRFDSGSPDPVLPVTLDNPRETIFEQNRGFHLSLLQIAGNPVLTLLAIPVFTVLRKYLTPMPAEFWIQRDNEHESILAAIHKSDSDAAGRLMGEHLRNLKPAYSDFPVVEGPRDFSLSTMNVPES